MSGSAEKSWLRKVVDTLHGSKWARIVPIIIAVALYALFLIFGNAETKERFLGTPIWALIWYWGSFMVVYVQVRNAERSEGFLNTVILLTTIVFAWGSVNAIVHFLLDMSGSFNPAVMLGPVTWSSISLAHSKRKDQ